MQFECNSFSRSLEVKGALNWKLSCLSSSNCLPILFYHSNRLTNQPVKQFPSRQRPTRRRDARTRLQSLWKNCSTRKLFIDRYWINFCIAGFKGNWINCRLPWTPPRYAKAIRNSDRANRPINLIVRRVSRHLLWSGLLPTKLSTAPREQS